MLKISELFKESFFEMTKKDWDYIYVYIDVHGTIFKPTWKRDVIDTDFYPDCCECLRQMTNDSRIKTVLWTGSYKEAIEAYFKAFKDSGIHFDYVNENPEVGKDKVGDFTVKPYFNILLDDRAGFDPFNDWKEILQEVYGIQKMR